MGRRRLRKQRVMSICAALTALLVGAVVFAPSEASAQRVRRKYKDKIHVKQPKPVLQKERFEFTPRFGIGVNDPVQSRFSLGGSINYHISERVFAGAIFNWYDFGGVLGGPTDLYDDVYNETRTAIDAALISMFGGAEVGFVPVFGKFALFNSGIIYYDLSVTLGAGYVSSKSIALTQPSGTVGVTWSAVSRVFLAEWLALNVEFRNVMFGARLQNADSAFTNSMSVAAGLSFYLPTSFEYETYVEKSERDADSQKE
jgi:outer membrane beta-barrel protein